MEQISTMRIFSPQKFSIQEDPMLLRDFFAERAEEYVRLAQQTPSSHDRQIFIAMARAWYGLTEKEPQVHSAASRPH
jgi:hypothetical protein